VVVVVGVGSDVGGVGVPKIITNKASSRVK
jgi:hypothetical protein